MDIKSKYLKEFINEITRNNRNPKDLKALELLDETDSNPEIVLPIGSLLYRSRVVTKSNKKNIGKVSGYYGFDADGSSVTPREHTKDMRANYRYIPYLYCATHAYLSIVEVRPRLGSEVSVATIQVNEEVHLLDFTISKTPKKKMTDAKINLFLDLSALYSVPVTDDDDVIEYIPTQFIAEYAKNLGYDGIAFSSSLTPEINSDDLPPYNVVIFKYQKTAPVKSNLITIEQNYLKAKQIDSDHDVIDIENIMLKNTKSIIGGV